VEFSDAIVTWPCLELDMFLVVEPTPLNYCLAVKNKKKAGTLPLDWVLQIVKEIRYFVELSCDGFEEELLALFVAIEVSNS